MNRFTSLPAAILCLWLIYIGIPKTQGQITLNSHNFPVGGLTIMRAYCLAVPNVLGNPGPNQTYDFQNINPLYHDTVKYYPAAATPWASYHPGAGVADAVDNYGIITVNYYSTDTSAFIKTGLTMIGDFGQGPDTVHGDFSPADTVLSTGYTYGYTDQEYACGTINNFIPFGVFTTETRRDVWVDGWGQLQTPVNSYPDVLRIKYREFRYDTATIFGTPVYTFIDTAYYFKFYAKDIRHPVVTAYTDSSYNLIYFEYIFSPPVIYGCMDSMAQNYNPLATQPDGNCTYCNVNYTISGDTTLCSPASIELHAGGGTTYLWFNGSTDSSITVNATQSSTYSVYVSSSPHCHALATVNVNVEQPVTATFWTTQSSYGTGENIQFINLSSHASMYEWNFDDSVNGSSNQQYPMHAYTSPGLKFVTLRAWNTCYADSTFDTLDIYSTASVSSVDAAGNIRIFPNPGSELLIIEGIIHEISPAEIRVFDLSGRLLLSQTAEHNGSGFREQIDMASLPSGIYLIGVTTANFNIISKWIKTQ